jgi:hypothetical protein
MKFAIAKISHPYGGPPLQCATLIINCSLWVSDRFVESSDVFNCDFTQNLRNMLIFLILLNEAPTTFAIVQDFKES